MTHTGISSAARPAKIPLIGGLVAALRTLWSKFQKERRLGATIHTLHRLNDHSLRDIGLERDTIVPVVRSRYVER